MSTAESQSLVAAYQALHFHALQAMLPAWAAATPRGGIPELLRPMTLSDAHDALTAASDAVSHRLGYAQLAYAAKHSGAAALRSVLADLSRVRGDALPWRMAWLDDASSPIAAFSALEQAMRRALGEREQGPRLERRAPLYQYDARHSIAFAEEEVVVDRPLGDFAGVGHPLDWSKVAPQIFQTSVACEHKAIDPSCEPVRCEATLPRFMLYERVDWHLYTAVRSRYRNLIAIDLHLPPNGGIDLRYELFQSLSCHLVLYEGLGGLSVDSGRARIDAAQGGTRIMASKRLRHTVPGDPALSAVLNWMSMPVLAGLMNWFVHAGARR